MCSSEGCAACGECDVLGDTGFFARGVDTGEAEDDAFRSDRRRSESVDSGLCIGFVNVALGLMCVSELKVELLIEMRGSTFDMGQERLCLIS